VRATQALPFFFSFSAKKGRTIAFLSPVPRDSEVGPSRFSLFPVGGDRDHEMDDDLFRMSPFPPLAWSKMRLFPFLSPWKNTIANRPPFFPGAGFLFFPIFCPRTAGEARTKMAAVPFFFFLRTDGARGRSFAGRSTLSCPLLIRSAHHFFFLLARN